ncbi:MAG: hypothetical protein WD648_04465 [Planctomycetaceae bacterium]
MKMTLHESFDPDFRDASTIRSFGRLTDDRPASVDFNGRNFQERDHEQTEVKVRVPDGSVVKVITEKAGDTFGQAKLVVPGLDKPLTPDEVWELAKANQIGFGID